MDTTPPTDILRVGLSEATEALEAHPFLTFLRRGDCSVELYRPHEADWQQPHDRDEIYIVASGHGIFRRGGGDDLAATRIAFAPGDLIFVPADVPHAFETFSNDFRTWVIFFGPVGGSRSDGAVVCDDIPNQPGYAA